MIESAPSNWSVIDLLDLVLDKGIVVDASLRVSAPGIELLAVEVVVTSITVYLAYHQMVPAVRVHTDSPVVSLPEPIRALP